MSDRPAKSLHIAAPRLLPLAVALLCASWIFLLRIYLPPKPAAGYALIALAFVLLGWRAWRSGEYPVGDFLAGRLWVNLLGVVGCGLASLVFPLPYSIGALPLGLAWIVLSFQKKPKVARIAGEALALTGLLLVLSAALLPLVFAWAARVHQLGGLGYLLAVVAAWLLRLLGQPVDFRPGGALFLHTFEDPYTITITAEKLLPVPIVLFALVWSIIILVNRRKPRGEALLFFWVTLSGYLLLRLVILVLLMIQRVNPSFFWDPWILLLSLVPLALILKDTSPAIGQARIRPGGQASDLASVIWGFIFAAAVVFALTFRDPGVHKSGRVMINEHGSDWEWTTDTLNTEIYNEKTTYNYYCLAQYLRYYYDLSTNSQPLSPQVLQDVDVLILKIPTQPYAPEEIEAVVNFVRQGGGLWVIGDHTNVFGSSSFFNPLLRRFGYSFTYTSTHDLASGNLSLYDKPARFAHPTISNLPPYLFATSCALRGSWKASSAILGYGLRADHLDYSQKNFFADRSRKQFDMQFGLFIQQAAQKFGRGRLLLYTDSTTFSNFFIFMRGKPELVLGSLDWLNRRPRYAWVNYILLLLALIALVVLLVRGLVRGAAVAGILLGASLAGWAADFAARAAYPLPQPVRPVPWVNFEREHSRYFLPVLRLANEGDMDYLTFYVWTQRVGAVPREMDDFQKAVQGADPLVMIDPVDTLDSGETAQLRAYLERGGRLLLINSTDNASGASKLLLNEFGLQWKTVPAAADSLHTLTLAGRYFPLRVNQKFSSLTGGAAFLASDQGEALGVEQAIGKGKIWALSCGHLFRNKNFGQTSVIPDAGLRALYEVEYRIIREMLKR